MITLQHITPALIGFQISWVQNLASFLPASYRKRLSPCCNRDPVHELLLSLYRSSNISGGLFNMFHFNPPDIAAVRWVVNAI